MNPYRGCEHGCVYCFARPSHAYLDLSPGLDFETKLFAKTNAADLLRAELAKPGYVPAPIALGINTDGWQPIERRHGISRACLEVLLEARHPLSIVTKGSALLRDLDLLAELAKHGLVSVFVSITSLDNTLSSKLEPRAAAPHMRLKMLSALRDAGSPLHGMQTWVALPQGDQEVEPSFHHHAAASLPGRDHAGARLRVIAGRAFGMESPVKVFADTWNVAVDLAADAELELAPEAVERALYVLEGEAQLDGTDIPDKHLLVLDRGVRHVLRAKTPLKAMLLGGEPLDGPRYMWWNFVSSSKERIEQARHDWDEGRFGLIPGDDVERIPLPER